MQKKLIALAVAGMFAAPAFAATSNVDVYGLLNVSVENVDMGGASSSFNRMVSNNNSAIGVKGTEDLGGGLSAVWQVEANLGIDGSQSNVTDAGAIYGTRNTFIGLSSKDMGTVVAGTHDTPYKMATGKLDNFVGTLGDYNGIFGNAAGNASTVFDLRTANTLAYISPNFDGLDFKLGYVMGVEGAVAPATSRSSAYSLSGTYANGPLFATAAYEKHRNVATGVCNVGATCLTNGTLDRHAWKVGAGFNMDDITVGAIYENMDGDAGTLVDHSTWGLNASFKMGAITLKGSYAKAGDLDNAAGVSVANTGAVMYALGADYAMSKRTTLQLTYAKMTNEAAGGWDLGQGQQVTNFAAGSDPSGFSLGMKHSF